MLNLCIPVILILFKHLETTSEVFFARPFSYSLAHSVHRIAGCQMLTDQLRLVCGSYLWSYLWKQSKCQGKDTFFRRLVTYL